MRISLDEWRLFAEMVYSLRRMQATITPGVPAAMRTALRESEWRVDAVLADLLARVAGEDAIEIPPHPGRPTSGATEPRS